MSNLNPETNRWRNTISEAFENLDDQLDQENIVITSLVIFDAVRNSYPNLPSDDLIQEVSAHISTALGIAKLLDEGRIEKFKDQDGLTRYKPRNMNPDPIDIASWAIKLLRSQNFNPNDETEFFDAFLRAYRASAQFIRDFAANEKTTCPEIYAKRASLHHPAQK
jgi:hypothetical protein